MSVNTGKVTGRRELHFADFAQLLSDAQYVATTPARTLGNWTVGQILEHLADAANCPFDGYGQLKAPWFARTFIAPLVKNRVLTKSMPAGFRLPKDATVLLPDSDIQPLDAFGRLEKALARFSHEIPSHAHPFLGTMALQEWVALTLRHGEMHLSFIVPSESQPAN